MNILKHVLTSLTVTVLIAAPMAHARQAPGMQAPEVILSENPPTLAESAAYVGLFLVAAYALKTFFPPVPVEPVVCPVVEAPAEVTQEEDTFEFEQDLLEVSTELEEFN